jgi:hypothetical protein
MNQIDEALDKVSVTYFNRKMIESAHASLKRLEAKGGTKAIAYLNQKSAQLNGTFADEIHRETSAYLSRTRRK